MDEPSTRGELLTRERERWADLQELIDAVPASRTDEPTVDPDGWSARDVVWHLSCWNDFVRAQLELIRSGTFDPDFALFSEPAYRHMDDHVPGLRRSLQTTSSR